MSDKSHARRLGFKLFLEGQEIDMISCKVTGGINQGAVAQISIPCNSKAHELLPRTLVHVFFYENKYELGTSVEKSDYGTGFINSRPIDLSKRQAAKDKGAVSQLLDYEDIMNWKLLFTGEIIGYGFSKIGAIRSINLVCRDFSSYWEMAQMYWGGAVRNDTKKRSIFVGATRLYSGPKTKVSSTSALIKILTAKPNGHLQPEGILGGLVSLLESSTGVFSPGENGKKHRGVNDMMSYAELRLHLTRTIGASDRDDTASVFMSGWLFKKWLMRVGKSIGYTANYLQLIQTILPKVHYEWNSVPAPPYVPSSSALAQHKWETIPTSYKGGSDVSELVKRCKKSYKAIHRVRDDTVRNPKHLADLNFSADRMRWQSNNGVQAENVQTKTLSEVTLHAVGHIAEWKTARALRTMGVNVRNEMYKKSKGSHRVRSQADKVQKAFEDAAAAVDEIVLVKSDETKRLESKFWDILVLLKRAIEGAGGRLKKPSKRVRDIDAKANSRLHMQLFRPDLYMCPPPKCNVLFPDMITSIQYSRNWMSEVTRFWLFTTNSSGRSMRNMYFAPSTSLLLGKTAKQKATAAEQAVKERTSFHMNHERHTGIIPTFQAIQDWKRMKKAYKKNVSSKDDPLKDMTNPYLVRAANYLFFKKRFSTRVMRLTLRFSPQLVVGLPCIVLDPVEMIDDKRADRFLFDDNSARLIKTPHFSQGDVNTQGTGTHYIGVIASVEHLANANGGAQTKVILSHCRTHTEGSRIFSDDGKGLSTWTFKSYTSKKLKSGNAKAELLGDFKGTDVYDQDWERVLGDKYNPKAKYTAEVVRTSEGKNKYTHFDAGHKSALIDFQDPAKHPRKDVGATQLPVPNAFGFPDVVYNVPAVELKVYELTKMPKAYKIDFTFEGLVTPPWYARIFFPENIGKDYYQAMVGCPSVLDEPPIHLDEKTLEQANEIAESDAAASKSLMKEAGLKGSSDIRMVTIHEEYGIHNETTGMSDSHAISVPLSLVQKSMSAEAAAEALAETWLGLKRMNANVNIFMDTYVDRAYATMFDIFGNMNPQIYGGMSLGSHGQYVDEAPGIEGFHGWAFGLFTDLEYLDDAAKERLVQTPNVKMTQRAVKPEIDTRKEKWLRVKDYKLQLLRSVKDREK